MYFSNEERRVICFLRLDEGLSLREIARLFHQRFPHRPIPSPIGISKMIQKIRATGCVTNRPKSGRPRSATDEQNEVMVLGSVVMKRQQSIREVANETGNSMTSVWRILRRYEFHPYGVKLTQELKESDYEKRLDFCELMDTRIRDPDFLKKVCFSDESTFHLNGYVNRHNCRYWCEENPNEHRDAHTQRPQKLNVWAGILVNEIIGPFFIAMRVSAARQNIPWAEVYFH